MAETPVQSEEKEQELCAMCGKPVVENDSGEVVHVSGGAVTQKCNNCGWTGGQIGRFTACPRCGDQTNLIDDHLATT